MEIVQRQLPRWEAAALALARLALVLVLVLVLGVVIMGQHPRGMSAIAHIGGHRGISVRRELG